jgi:hypothetical protein
VQHGSEDTRETDLCSCMFSFFLQLAGDSLNRDPRRKRWLVAGSATAVRKRARGGHKRPRVALVAQRHLEDAVATIQDLASGNPGPEGVYAPATCADDELAYAASIVYLTVRVHRSKALVVVRVPIQDDICIAVIELPVERLRPGGELRAGS